MTTLRDRSNGEGKRTTSSARRNRLWLACLLCTVPVGLSQPDGGTGPRTADLIVCAEASNLPFSDAQEEGFENRLAELLADELGVSLAYRWMDFGTTLRRHALLERGDCDLVMAVSEGQQGYLTTIAYYSSTHVFVYRSDAPFEIATLDDAVLRDLRVGVQMPAGANAGPAVEALAVRELIGNAVHFAPDPERAQPLAGIVEAVAAGEVDLAIAWGPVAGYFAAQQAEDLRIVPVEPAIVKSRGCAGTAGRASHRPPVPAVDLLHSHRRQAG